MCMKISRSTDQLLQNIVSSVVTASAAVAAISIPVCQKPEFKRNYSLVSILFTLFVAIFMLATATDGR